MLVFSLQTWLCNFQWAFDVLPQLNRRPWTVDRAADTRLVWRKYPWWSWWLSANFVTWKGATCPLRLNPMLQLVLEQRWIWSTPSCTSQTILNSTLQQIETKDKEWVRKLRWELQGANKIQQGLNFGKTWAFLKWKHLVISDHTEATHLFPLTAKKTMLTCQQSQVCLSSTKGSHLLTQKFHCERYHFKNILNVVQAVVAPGSQYLETIECMPSSLVSLCVYPHVACYRRQCYLSPWHAHCQSWSQDPE